jgi:hypothetical protein
MPKWFSRDPALYLTAALALLQLVAVLAHLSADQQNGLSVIATAVYAILLAVFTRPLQPSAIVGGLATILTAMAAFGVDLRPDLVSGLNATVAAVLALVLRAQVSPAPALARRL